MGRKRGGEGGEDAPFPSVPAGALDPIALGFPPPPGAAPAPAAAPALPSAPVPTPPAPASGAAAPPPGPGLGLPIMPQMPGMPQMPQMGQMGQFPGLPGQLPGLQMGLPGLPGMPGQMRPGLPMPPKAPGMGLPGMPSMGAMGLLPGMAAPPRLPGMPPPGSLDSEALAQMRFQQVAVEYEQIKSAGIDPQVQELAEYHGLDERATRALDEEMKKRRGSFESDMQALWVGLEGSKNPSGMLMMKLKDMRMGVFKGMTALNKKIQDFAKRNRLDAQAAVKLGEVMEGRDDIDGDLAKIAKHLERSNKPSSLMMMMLRELRDGKPVKDPEYAAAIGSKIHERELRDAMKDRDRSRSKPRGGRDESKGGRHDRERRDRDRDRERDRDRRDDRRDRGDRERGGGDRGDRGDRGGGGERGDRGDGGGR
ncbi:unnamed protein product [Effrenium voratum]|uniref:Uncharacterized protein n=1 Tax=Effrenium voratum TaxID=2562239 RepID=A0AA36JEG6_9DINO|nr:unnamed protein product [Effrenium voratum]